MTAKKETLTLFLGLGLLLGGCSSKSELYRLHPTIQSSEGTRTLREHRLLGIAEVEVADYLEKPELVTRLSPTHLQPHDEEQWAGSLSGSVQEVLQENLTALLPGVGVLRYPWEEPLSDPYRLYVSIDRFDGDLNGTVTLAGRWSLIDRREDRLVAGERFRYSAKGPAEKTDDIVATQSSLLERLSRRIASKIRRYYR